MNTMHKGSCHCGAVKFEASVDAAGGTRCNCSICTKLGPIGATTKPDGFHLLQGKDRLRSYAMSKAGERYYCEHCGVFVYGAFDIPEMGGATVSVNLNTLDDIDPGLLSVRYWDGRHDNWMAGPREEPWPIG